MIISSKAGYKIWNGPYGDNGSKKYLISSLGESLKRINLEYVDVFYYQKPDNYKPERAKKAFKILNDLGTTCFINQPRYNLFDR